MVTSSAFVTSTWTNAHQALLNDSFRTYNSKIRPSLNGEPTSVTVNFSPVVLNFIDEKSESLNMKSTLNMYWYDSRIQWKIGDYSNITLIDIPQSDMWLPPIQIYNSLKPAAKLGFDEQTVRIYSTGIHHWTVVNTMETACAIEISFYPFDTQVCEVTIYTPGVSVQEVNMIVDNDNPVNTNYLSESASWEFVGEGVAHTVLPDLENYQIISFKMWFKRRTSFYVLNIVLPVIFLSLTASAVFLLPGEETTFGLFLKQTNIGNSSFPNT